MNRSLSLFCLILIIGFLSGCASTPITDGHHVRLPEGDTPVIVWGNNPAVVETATTWLKKRGLRMYDPATLESVLDVKSLQWVHTFEDEKNIIEAARKLGAKEVVFANEYGDRRAPSVSVRGLNVQDNLLEWMGSARYSGFLKDPKNDMLARLTCQALATAWGYREPGEKWFQGSIGLCMVDEEDREAKK
jgi:hypothetical protein